MLENDDPGSDAWLLRSREISDPRYETLLAALVEHEFEKRSSPRIPEWTRSLALGNPWVHANLRRGVAWTRKNTPKWLADRGIYISEHDLMTA
jgi:hypothetical protein